MGSWDATVEPLGNIKEVAVIGAGISGVTTAAHLLRQGLKVVVFERSSIAGGVWHFDSRSPIEPEYPNYLPHTPNKPGYVNGSRILTETKNGESFENISLLHAPPGPCYAGLRNNVPTTLMRSTLMDWPVGTEECVGQELIEKYVQDVAVHTGVQDTVLYDTSVDSVWKTSNSRKWNIHTRTLRKTGSSPEFLGRSWEFDAVVVASGHYHEPRVPNFPGLTDWKQRYPDRVMHSKSYRRPNEFKEKTVLIIGAGVSSLDIAREISSVAKHVYQSARGGQFDLPANLLPSNAERVDGINRFILDEGVTASGIPGKVVLQDGKKLDGIDVVIVATGYITTYPFLGDLQDPSSSPESAGDETIITSDGCITHNLHKDICWIPDPSLAFVGVPYYTSTFSLFDFQAEVVARVMAGKAKLPGEETLRQEYVARKANHVGSIKSFHSLFQKELQYIDDILGWVNEEARGLGHEQMKGVDEKWRARYTEFVAEIKKRREFEPAKEFKETLVTDRMGAGLEIASA